MQLLNETNKETKISESLQLSEKKVITALNAVKFSDLSDIEISKFFITFISLIGFPERNMPKENDYLMLVDVSRNILNKYTQSEILLAVELALTNQIKFDFNLYDKTFSIALLSDLMKAYYSFRQEAIYKNDRLLNSKPMEHTPDEIKQLNLQAGRSAFVRIFKDFKETRVFKKDEPGYIETMACIYDYLDDRKIISIPNDRKKSEIEKAERFLRSRLENERMELKNKENLHKLTSQLKNWNQTVIEQKEIINDIAKSLIIEDYISYSIDMDMDLSDIL
jgi:hypothetical protein